MSKARYLCPLLGLFWCLALAGQYLFDDFHLIVANPSLQGIQSFSDVLAWELKPTKPVANFVLAFAHWLGSGQIWAQRMVSILLHTGVCFWLLILWQRLRPTGTETIHWRWLGCAAVSLFALAPVHSEGLLISWFRNDLLGTFFALAAAVVFSGRQLWGWWVLGSICLCLSVLSKEVFIILAPIAVLALGSRSHWTRTKGIIFSLSWFIGAVMLIQRLSWDYYARYSYASVLGTEVIGATEFIKLSLLSLFEGLGKLISGQPLTTVALRLRNTSLQWPIGILFVFVGALFLIVGRKKLSSFLICFLSGAAVYLFVPNINVGSERYWYFAAIGFYPLMVWCIWEASRRKPKVVGLFIGVVLVLFAQKSYSRISETQSRLSHYGAEALRHPESWSVWNNLAVALLETEQHWPQARLMLEKANQLAPNHPRVRMTRFLWHLKKDDLEIAEDLLLKFTQNESIRGGAHQILANAFALQRRCNSANRHWLIAAELGFSPRPDQKIPKDCSRHYRALWALRDNLHDS